MREEFDITKIRNKNWKKFVEEIITSYEFLLTDSLETAGQDTKQNIIKVIYALSFTHEGNKLDIEDYDRKAASIPYTDIEKQMKNKLSKVFNSSH